MVCGGVVVVVVAIFISFSFISSHMLCFLVFYFILYIYGGLFRLLLFSYCFHLHIHMIFISMAILKMLSHPTTSLCGIRHTVYAHVVGYSFRSLKLIRVR